MSTKVSDLPVPELIYEGKGNNLRNWWKFGDGEGAVTVTEGPCSHGHSFICHTDTSKHECVHIRALERHLGIKDFRNETPRTSDEVAA